MGTDEKEKTYKLSLMEGPSTEEKGNGGQREDPQTGSREALSTTEKHEGKERTHKLGSRVGLSAEEKQKWERQKGLTSWDQGRDH